MCSLYFLPVLLPSMLINTVAISLGSITPNPALQSQPAEPNKKAEEVQHLGNKCPECLIQFSSKEEVAEHFQEIKAAHTTVSLLCLCFSCCLIMNQNKLQLNSFSISAPPTAMHRLFSSHAPAKQLQCSSSSAHPPKPPSTCVPRVWRHGQAATISVTSR